MKDALPRLSALAWEAGALEDEQIEAAVGFADQTRGRSKLSLHQQRSVWINSLPSIRNRVVAQLEKDKTQRDKDRAKELLQRTQNLNKARKERKKALRDRGNRYCYCGEVCCGGACEFWVCETGVGYCPFRGYIHKCCAKQRGEVVTQTSGYHCHFCKLHPKPEVKKRAVVAEASSDSEST